MNLMGPFCHVLFISCTMIPSIERPSPRAQMLLAALLVTTDHIFLPL